MRGVRVGDIPGVLRVCSTCEQVLPVSEFGKHMAHGKEYLHRKCKVCVVKRSMKYNAEHPDEHAAHDSAYQKRHVKQVSRRRKSRMYGMTEIDLAALEAASGGLCAICGVVDHTKNLLCVDHDHATGKVRGMLCKKCNSGLGMFKDDETLMLRAILYLRRSTEWPAS